MLHVQQRIQFCKAGRLGLQFFLLRKRLGDFNLCGLLLLFQRIQCGISIGNAVGKIADGIVQTDDVAARVIAQRYRITQLAAENDLMPTIQSARSRQSAALYSASYSVDGLRRANPSRIAFSSMLDSHRREKGFLHPACW